ncbi:MAG: thioredoxin family protein [Tepidisphaeraceae bacterium]
MKTTLFALALTALAGVGIVASRSFAEDKAATAAAKVGAAAPTFTLPDQDGTPVSLEQYKGKVVVLEWTNNECPYVKKFYDQGDMNKLASSYKAKGVVWLAIDSSKHHDVAHSKQVATEWKVERPILSDQSGTVGHQYGAKTTPHMYVIDPAGTLVYAGAIDDTRSTEQSDIAKATNYVAKALDEVLAGKSVSTPETKSYGCSVKY